MEVYMNNGGVYEQWRCMNNGGVYEQLRYIRTICV